MFHGLNLDLNGKDGIPLPGLRVKGVRNSNEGFFRLWAPLPNGDYLPERPLGCCLPAQRSISGKPLRGLPLVASSGRPLWALACVAFAYGRGPFSEGFRQKVFNSALTIEPYPLSSPSTASKFLPQHLFVVRIQLNKGKQEQGKAEQAGTSIAHKG